MFLSEHLSRRSFLLGFFSLTISDFTGSWEDGDGANVNLHFEGANKYTLHYDDNTSGQAYFPDLQALNGQSLTSSKLSNLLSLAIQQAANRRQEMGLVGNYYLGSVYVY
jgi:hypothetical protein